MNVTAIAIISIIFGTAYGIVKTVLNYKKESVQYKQGDVSLIREIDSLKERVATLEKIVTDDKYQLHKEFEKLWTSFGKNKIS